MRLTLCFVNMVSVGFMCHAEDHLVIDCDADNIKSELYKFIEDRGSKFEWNGIVVFNNIIKQTELLVSIIDKSRDDITSLDGGAGGKAVFLPKIALESAELFDKCISDLCTLFGI